MSHAPLTETELGTEVESIAADIWDSRLELPDGETAWPGYNSSWGNPVLMAPNGLYGGRLGIAVFFGAVHTATGTESYRRYAERAAEALMETDETILIENTDLGAGDGVGSYIYGFSLLGALLDEPAYRSRAEELIRALTRERIERDYRYDVLSGAAGTILALSRVYEQTGDAHALETAVQCGEHLLENRQLKWNRYQVWDTSRKSQPRRIRTGMGHGVGGIGYALSRLYGHTSREMFRRAAADAVSFEDVFYSAYENNWKANPTTIKSYQSWWCNGLVGIGNARLGSLEHHRSEPLVRDLDRLKRGFDPELASDDSICHGTFAQVDLLVELGRRGDDRMFETARNLAGSAVERRRADGFYRVAFGDVEGLHNPALFLGTAGIGYTLLRTLRPEMLPCLLRFE